MGNEKTNSKESKHKESVKSNKQGMRTTQGREKQEMKHRRREGSKNKDIIASRKIDHRNFLIFFGKKTDTKMMKKKKT